jgi:hypothetical protein
MLPFALPCYRGIREIGEFLDAIFRNSRCTAFIFCISWMRFRFFWTIWPESNVLGTKIKYK